jgi:hypothetical protein
MKPDISMDQKAVIQQLLGKMPDKGNQINIIQIGEIHGSDREFNFDEFLDSLPEPRLKSLVDLAKKSAAKKFERTNAAAEYLGVSIRTVSSFKVVRDGDQDEECERKLIESG